MIFQAPDQVIGEAPTSEGNLQGIKRRNPVDPLKSKQITVLLAEDQASFRKSLKLLIELDGDIEVVGEAKNGLEAVRNAKNLKPDAIVMDIAMPLLNGLEATRQIMEILPATRVLILSAHPDPEYIKQAMTLGASGYLLKQSSTQFLAEAIRTVLRNGTYFSQSISKLLRDQCQKLFVKSELLKRPRLG